MLAVPFVGERSENEGSCRYSRSVSRIIVRGQRLGILPSLLSGGILPSSRAVHSKSRLERSEIQATAVLSNAAAHEQRAARDSSLQSDRLKRPDEHTTLYCSRLLQRQADGDLVGTQHQVGTAAIEAVRPHFCLKKKTVRAVLEFAFSLGFTFSFSSVCAVISPQCSPWILRECGIVALSHIADVVASADALFHRHSEANL